MSDKGDGFGRLDEVEIFTKLDASGVEYVVVGGSAAILWGATRATRDVDCVVRQTTENHQRLCNALEAMGHPRLRIEGVDDDTATELSRRLLHPDFFDRTSLSTWRTDHGSIDGLADIADATGQPVDYDQLARRSVLTPTGAIRIRVASLDDLIDSKTYVDRDKDREALPELHELRRRLEHDT